LPADDTIPVINEPSNAGYLPAAVNCTKLLAVLKVLPAVVTVVGNTPTGKVFVPVILAAVRLVKLAPLMAGSDVIVKAPVLSIVAFPLTGTGDCGANVVGAVK